MSKPGFDELAYKLVDQVVTISDGVRDRFETTDIDTNSKKFQTLYTGVNLDEFDIHAKYDTDFGFEDDESVNIVQVAKIHPRKRQENLIKAIGEVSDELPSYNVILAGPVAEGHEQFAQSLEDLANQEGIRDHVHFLGWCDEVPALLSKADLFVLPSSNEGFPRSILEAYAMGVPVVATPAGGTDELVQDGKTGLLVPIDDVESLGAAISEVLTAPNTHGEFSKAARRRVIQNFQQREYVEGFEKLVSSHLQL